MGKFAKSIRISFRTWHPTTCSPGAMEGGERMGLEIASLAFSAFAFGFTLCNGIWVFFGPSAQEKRERRKCERSKGDQDGND